MIKNPEPTPKKHWFLRLIIKAAILILALVLLTQLGLKLITQHGKEIIVPDFSYLSVPDAKILAHRYDLTVEVTDSVSVKRMEPGAVFAQNPAAGSSVKKGRRIMLTINSYQAKTVEVPNVVGYSLRQAKTELIAKGLTVGKLSYKEDMATNNVLEQKYKGKRARPGTELEVDTPIDLVLGLAPDEDETYVPYLVGFTLAIAKDNIIESSLNVGRISYDETVKTYQDSVNAVVYRQNPPYNNNKPAKLGTSVSLALTVKQSKVSPD